MPAVPQASTRTRAYARVIGPYVSIVAAIVIVRTPDTATPTVLFEFFENEAIVWLTGGVLLFAGLLIIAFHQHWSGLSAILISLFGWLLALRGVVLLAAPHLIERGAAAAMTMMPLVQIGFAVLLLIGLWLTYAGWIAKPEAG